MKGRGGMQNRLYVVASPSNQIILPQNKDLLKKTYLVYLEYSLLCYGRIIVPQCTTKHGHAPSMTIIHSIRVPVPTAWLCKGQGVLVSRSMLKNKTIIIINRPEVGDCIDLIFDIYLLTNYLSL